MGRGRSKVPRNGRIACAVAIKIWAKCLLVGRQFARSALGRKPSSYPARPMSRLSRHRVGHRAVRLGAQQATFANERGRQLRRPNPLDRRNPETHDPALFNLAIASAWRRSMAFDSTRRTGYSQLQRGYSFRNILPGVQEPPCFRPKAPSTWLLRLSLREY
jgi:hypothetical protein